MGVALLSEMKSARTQFPGSEVSVLLLWRVHVPCVVRYVSLLLRLSIGPPIRYVLLYFCCCDCNMQASGESLCVIVIYFSSNANVRRIIC